MHHGIRDIVTLSSKTAGITHYQNPNIYTTEAFRGFLVSLFRITPFATTGQWEGLKTKRQERPDHKAEYQIILEASPSNISQMSSLKPFYLQVDTNVHRVFCFVLVHCCQVRQPTVVNGPDSYWQHTFWGYNFSSRLTPQSLILRTEVGTKPV